MLKKIILAVVILGMLGYATYEFISSNDEADQEDTDNNEGGMITSPAPDDDDSEDDTTDPSDNVGIQKGDLAPDFELETLDGEPAKLSDYKGERVIVNFWATWCPPCRAEIPDLKKLDNNHDVTILALNMTHSEENEEKVTDFVDEFDMTFPVLLDTDGDVSRTFEVAAYPTSYYIDSDGHIQYIALGAMNYDQMAQELEKID